jgi:hypothetical protein
MLRPGEVVLLRVETAATTVFDGPGGFLHFRRWEAVQPPPVGHTILLGLAWTVTDDFVLGGMGREPLRELLNKRAVAQIRVVPQGVLASDLTVDAEIPDLWPLDMFPTPSGATETATLIAQATLLGAAFEEQLKREWHGVIMAEAATTFADGATVIQQPEYASLAEAQAWVLTKLTELLAAEEQVSQAVVLGPNGTGFELMPSTWPVPGFEHGPGRLDWIAIEVDGEEA